MSLLGVKSNFEILIWFYKRGDILLGDSLGLDMLSTTIIRTTTDTIIHT